METAESSKNWDNLFEDLNKAECDLEIALSVLIKGLDNSKYVKTGLKADEWRNLHSTISKNGKTIEKIYSGYNFDSESRFDRELERFWKEAISETLTREGFNFSSNSFENAQNHGKAYSQLSKFIESFESESYLIFEWIKKKLPDSSDKENLLAEFTQYLFFRHLQQNNLQEALILIRENIKYFKNPDNQKMINKLLTKCLYFRSQPGCGFEKRQIETLKEHFVKSYCKNEKIPKSDPLTACNEIGTKSIPPLDRLNSLFKGKNYTTLSSEEELPIELPVEEQYVFHSIFCCPVIKQQSSDENPAYLLPCSHALSKEALNRLSKGNALVRFKCPYCPTETNLSNCLQLNF